MNKRLLTEMRFMMERLESPRMTDTELTARRKKLINEDNEIKYIKLYEEVESVNDSKKVTDKINQLKAYFKSSPRERDRTIGELEGIRDGLDDNGKWTDQEAKEQENDYYQLWMYHYRGFTKSDMQNILKGLEDKGLEDKDENLNQILTLVSKYFKDNPDQKGINLLDKIESLYNENYK